MWGRYLVDRQSTVILLLFYTILRRVSYMCSQVRFIYKKKWPYLGSNTSHLIVYLSKPLGPVTCGYHPRSHNNSNNTRVVYIHTSPPYTTYVFTVYIYILCFDRAAARRDREGFTVVFINICR